MMVCSNVGFDFLAPLQYSLRLQFEPKSIKLGVLVDKLGVLVEKLRVLVDELGLLFDERAVSKISGFRPTYLKT